MHITASSLRSEKQLNQPLSPCPDEDAFRVLAANPHVDGVEASAGQSLTDSKSNKELPTPQKAIS